MPDLNLPGSRSAPDPEKPGGPGQRQKLIDGLVLVVMEHGYSQTTIAKVAEAAGLTKKAFSAHFSSLEECFVAAYEQGVGKIMPLVLEFHRQQQNWAEGIRSAPPELLPAMAHFVLLPLIGREAARELQGPLPG